MGYTTYCVGNSIDGESRLASGRERACSNQRKPHAQDRPAERLSTKKRERDGHIIVYTPEGQCIDPDVGIIKKRRPPGVVIRIKK